MVTANARSAFHSGTASSRILVKCIRDKLAAARTSLDGIAARDRASKSGAWNRADWIYPAIAPVHFGRRFCRAMRGRYGRIFSPEGR
jgi:hypothetical protein